MNTIKSVLTYVIEKIILTWQFIIILLIFLMLPTLKILLQNTEKLKIGDFQFTVKELAKNSGVTSEQIKDLNGLTYDELKIFLIKGGEDANYYNFMDNSTNRDKFIKTFRDLDFKGLIKIVKFDSTYIDSNHHEYNFYTNTTSKGEKIHRAILDAIYQNFVEARINEPK